MKVLAFKVEIDGVTFAIKNQEDLTAAVKLTNEAFQKADFGTKKYQDLEKALAGLKRQQREIANASKDAAAEQRKAAQAAADAAEIASGSYKGLKLELRQVQNAYEGLSAAERDTAGPELLNRIARIKGELAEYRQDVRDTGREQTIAADKGGDSYRALNAELVNLRRTYKELSAAERDTIGRPLLQRIEQLDKELKEIDANMGQYQRNVGNYSSAFGDLVGLDFAALATPAGAIAAAGAAAIAATAYIKQTTDQVRALRGEIQTLTGATGDELDGFTAKTQAIADTFELTSNEVTQSANALSKQLGISFESALERIGTSLSAGLNANGELLDSVREYPTFFAEAFGEGERGANIFFEVIKRGNEQGIFNDKAVDAVKEVALRLRELPQTTKDALTAIGLSSDEIAKQIQDEGVGSAISTVAARLGQLEKNSPEVGQAIADIFGGAGEDAGVDFLISLQDINDATGELIDTNNEYQLQQQRTLAVNEEFAAAQVEVANAFGTAGASVDNLITQGQTLLLRFLVPVIEHARRMFDIFQPLITAITGLGRQLGFITEEGDLFSSVISAISTAAEFAIKPLEAIVFTVSKLVEGYTAVVGAGQRFLRFIGVLSEEQDEAAESSRNMGRGNAAARREYSKLQKEQEKSRKETEKARKEIDKLSKSTKAAAVVADKFAEGSLGALQAELSDLQKQLRGATGANEQSILSDILGVEKAIEEIKTGRERLREQLSDLAAGIEPAQILPNRQEAIEQIEPTVEATKEATARQKAILDKSLAEGIARSEQQARRQVEIEEQKAARIQEISSTLFSSFNSINGQLSQNSQTRTQNEINAVEERYEAEIEAAEGNAERQEELREELAEAQEAIRQEELERQKKYRIATALASLAEGTVNILSAPTTIPDPFGTIFKGVQIGFLGAQTALQIANIRRQQVAARGALVRGQVRGESHNGPNRGVSLFLNGQPVLAEDGERVVGDGSGGVAVINRRSSAVFKRELDALGGQTFPGKQAWLSSINSYKGFGDTFMERGGIVTPSLESIAAMNGASTSTRVQGDVRLSPESVQEVANTVGRAVYHGSKEGSADGGSDADRRKERQSRLRKRTG